MGGVDIEVNCEISKKNVGDQDKITIVVSIPLRRISRTRLMSPT
jgi:hypothetical protein